MYNITCYIWWLPSGRPSFTCIAMNRIDITQCGSSPDGEELPVDPECDFNGTHREIMRIVKAGCHAVAMAQVVKH